MYQCTVCKERFDNSELIVQRQYRGEWCGEAAYEYERFCPVCYGDVEYCGEWYGGEYDEQD